MEWKTTYYPHKQFLSSRPYYSVPHKNFTPSHHHRKSSRYFHKGGYSDNGAFSSTSFMRPHRGGVLLYISKEKNDNVGNQDHFEEYAYSKSYRIFTPKPVSNVDEIENDCQNLSQASSTEASSSGTNTFEFKIVHNGVVVHNDSIEIKENEDTILDDMEIWDELEPERDIAYNDNYREVPPDAKKISLPTFIEA